jgi:hypothetical protein
MLTFTSFANSAAEDRQPLASWSQGDEEGVSDWT